jgi:hypothetical protein
MPWAATATTSLLSTPDDTRRDLGSAGFEVEQVKDVLQRALDFGARSRALVELWRKAALWANALIHGDIAATTVANVARAYKDGCLVPIEVVAWKR